MEEIFRLRKGEDRSAMPSHRARISTQPGRKRSPSRRFNTKLANVLDATV